MAKTGHHDMIPKVADEIPFGLQSRFADVLGGQQDFQQNFPRAAP